MPPPKNKAVLIDREKALQMTEESTKAPLQLADNKQGQILHQSQINSSWDDDDWEARHFLLYDCRLSHRYHKKRERFLSFVDNVATALSLVAGASVVSKLLGADYSDLFGFTVVILTSVQLVFSLKEKSKQHSILAADFKKLEASIEKAGVIKSDGIAKFRAEYLLVETSDPPTLGLLVQICQNEMAIAENQPDKVNKIGWFRKLFAQFFDWPKDFESKKAKQ